MAEKMKTVHLNVTVVTGDGEFKPGSPVKIPEKDAADYLKRHGEVVASKGAAEKSAPKKPTGDALAKAILAAMSDLDKDNEDHFTASGKPVVSALEKLLGYDITAAERDAALATVSSDQKPLV
ncbi:hypothetical protein [Roseibium suaedae]|uniref:Uncharacterized protein n=1 Tax=Roseibium suaedae TaxID=735517 RepID=A0A1M7PLZ8_9HYPH|nr:hypothetical protein [Roseibium suaedae]SHN18244.1 hypothetical protein SAMN05444272_4498 [Roseibium suaedae]